MPLIATDLDGTLLRPDGTVSERSAQALHAAHRAGWHVVLASGRPPFMVTDLVEVLGGSVGHGVLANGSVICTLPEQKILRTVRFEIARATEVVSRLRAVDDCYGFALATNVGFAHEAGFAERMPIAPATLPTADVLAAAAGAIEALKLMVFNSRYSAHELLDLVPDLLGSELAVTHMGADCVEVGPAGIDKGIALRWLCDHLGVDASDVVAFGDEFNDHEMLAFAGHSVVMANANPITRSLADEITVSNVDDGVAVVLERLICERP